MAFDDSKRYSSVLRLKNPNLYQQCDPHARRDRCWSPWCNQFVEDMQEDNRCHTPECDRTLREKAVERKLMIQVGNVWFGSVEKLLQPPDNIQLDERSQQIMDERKLHTYDGELPMCGCGKNAKMPGRDVCPPCYREQRRQEAQERKEGRRQNQRGSVAGFNRISGLEALKDKLK